MRNILFAFFLFYRAGGGVGPISVGTFNCLERSEWSDRTIE